MNHAKYIANLLATALIVAVTGLCSCSGTADEPAAAGDEKGIVLQFSLSANVGDDTGSRADICEGDEPSVGWEDDMFISRTHILVYRHTDDYTGELIGSFSGSQLGNVGKLGSSVTVKLTGDYLQELRDAVVDVVVVANSDLPSDISTIEKVAGHVCRYSKPTGTTGIPMYGIRSGVYLGYLAGEGTEASPLRCGTINLLHAFAKIEVISALPKGYSLDNVTISTLFDSFYAAPYNSDTKTHLANTTNITSPCLPSDTKPTVYSGDITDGVNRFYLPEAAAGATNFITLTVRDEENKALFTDRTIEIARYEDGKIAPGSWLEIIRNHIYRYEITLTPDAEITVRVRVKKWGYHKIIFDM